MSTEQSITWTLLPKRLSDDNNKKWLHFSVYATIRLASTNNNLEGFTEIKDWPKTIQGLKFKVNVGNKPMPTERDYIEQPDDEFNSARWKVIFGNENIKLHSDDIPPKKIADTFKRFNQKITVISPNIAHIHHTLKSFYPLVVKEAFDKKKKTLPMPDEIITMIENHQDIFPEFDLRGVLETINKENHLSVLKMKELQKTAVERLNIYKGAITPRSLTTSLTSLGGAEMPEDTFLTQDSFQELLSFHTRPKTSKLPELDKTKLPDQFDFHQRLAALNQYPVLLKKLGIVVDLKVDITGTEQLLGDKFDSFVIVDGRPNDIFPLTSCVLNRNAATFHAQSDNINIQLNVKEGMLLLDDNFDLIQGDMDGAAIKNMNMLKSTVEQKKSGDVQESGYSGIRTDGFSIVHKTRQEWLKYKLLTRTDFLVKEFKQANAAPKLYADDLTRGYRLDIWDSSTKQWHSVCQRSGTYEFTRNNEMSLTVPDYEDEGMIQVGITVNAITDENGSDNEVIFAHQKFFNWTGWSLCVPRPGKGINDDSPGATNPDATNNNVFTDETEVLSELGLKTTFKLVAGSLPKLRFGRTYKMRARAVDLAGNSVSLNDAVQGKEVETEQETFRRFEPVPSPVIALVQESKVSELLPPKAGESMDRMAIRTYIMENQKDITQCTSEETAQRFLLPPRCTQQMAEYHEMFDDPVTGKLDGSKYSVITSFDGTLPEVTVPPEDSTGRALTRILEPRSARLETSYHQDHKGDFRYAFFIKSQNLPYLPDPLSHHIRVQVLDHKKELIAGVEDLVIAFYAGSVRQAWPHALPFRIQLNEGTTVKLEFDDRLRILNVWLKKAERIYLRCSASLEADDLQKMAMWSWRNPPVPI